MRPVLVKYLNEKFATGVFDVIFPDVAFLYSVAIFVCTVVFIRRVRLSGLPEYHGWGAAIAGSLGGILGVRIWWLVLNVGTVLQHPEQLLALNGPTVSFGGYLFGGLAFISYLALKGQKVKPYLDISVTCLGLGVMIGRWACFLNGDDYGTLTNSSIGVCYPPGSYPFADQVNAGILPLMAIRSLPVHPVQLYLSLNGLLLFFVTSYLWKKGALRPGMLFVVFWILYGSTRFILEFLRGDETVGAFGVLTSGQCACLGIVAGSIAILVFRSLTVRKWSIT